MSALITCAGADVIRGVVYMRRRGAWWADLKLDRATQPGGAATIAASGGFNIKGTVLSVSGGIFLDAAFVRVVAGAGGLGKTVSAAAYENAQVRDPLNAAMSASGEALSGTVSASVLAASLSKWTTTASRAAKVLDEIAFAAGQATGQTIGWRILSDGTVWLGTETWPEQALPTGSDIVDYLPSQNRYVIGAETPSILPGVAITGIGRVQGVDHFIEHDQIRSWVWI